MSATEAVWRLAKWVAEWIEGELREPGTYGPCLVDLSYGTVWYYVDRANTKALPFVFGALVLMTLAPFAIAFDIWASDQMKGLFQNRLPVLDRPMGFASS